MTPYFDVKKDNLLKSKPYAVIAVYCINGNPDMPRRREIVERFRSNKKAWEFVTKMRDQQRCIMMTIRKYTADDLHKLLMCARDERNSLVEYANDDLEQIAQVQALLDKVDGKHNFMAFETMAKTCGINMEGKTKDRIVCEICAYHSQKGVTTKILVIATAILLAASCGRSVSDAEGHPYLQQVVKPIWTTCLHNDVERQKAKLVEQLPPEAEFKSYKLEPTTVTTDGKTIVPGYKIVMIGYRQLWPTDLHGNKIVPTRTVEINDKPVYKAQAKPVLPDVGPRTD